MGNPTYDDQQLKAPHNAAKIERYRRITGQEPPNWAAVVEVETDYRFAESEARADQRAATSRGIQVGIHRETLGFQRDTLEAQKTQFQKQLAFQKQTSDRNYKFQSSRAAAEDRRSQQLFDFNRQRAAVEDQRAREILSF